MAYKLLLRCVSEYIGFRASRDTARVFKCFSVHTKKMWTAAVSLKGLNKGCFCVYCNWRNHWLRTTALLHNSEGSGWLCSMLWFSNAVELLLLFDEKKRTCSAAMQSTREVLDTYLFTSEHYSSSPPILIHTHSQKNHWQPVIPFACMRQKKTRLVECCYFTQNKAVTY